MIVSSATSMAFFTIVYRTKELFEVHPMNIIMYSILSESLGCISFAMVYHVCDFKLNEIFAYTVFFSDTLKD